MKWIKLTTTTTSTQPNLNNDFTPPLSPTEFALCSHTTHQHFLTNLVMNENLVERFGRARRAFRPEREQAQVWILPSTLNLRIRNYFQPSTVPIHGSAWLSRPAVPSTEEILDTDTASSDSADIVEIVPNKPQGAWESKGCYQPNSYTICVRPRR